MEIKIVNRSKHPLPEYKTKASAGMDIRHADHWQWLPGVHG